MSNSVWPHRWQPTRLPHPWDSPGKNTGVGCHFLLQCMKVKSESEVAQSCQTLCNPMDCSPSGSSVHGIFQARALEWVAISFSRGSSQPRDQTRVSHIAGRRFTVWATREAHFNFTLYVLPHPPPGGMEVSRQKSLYWTEDRGGHQNFLSSTGSWWKQCFLKVNFLYTD